MKTVIIVQARMNSTRLPGKVLKQIAGTPLLAYQVERLQHVHNADLLVIATTTQAEDDAIAKWCQTNNIDHFRGPENDVLTRYYNAAHAVCADVIVRITADCPLIDPVVIDTVIDFYKEHQADYDYVSNTLKRTYPRGQDTEVFPRRTLERCYQQATINYEREHVTPHIYLHPEHFRIGQVVQDSDLSSHRWTVDTEEDFQFVAQMLAELYPTNRLFTLKDCLTVLEEHPTWVHINCHVHQKNLSESQTGTTE